MTKLNPPTIGLLSSFLIILFGCVKNYSECKVYVNDEFGERFELGK